MNLAQIVLPAVVLFVVGCEPQERSEPTLSCEEYDEYEYELLNPAFWFGFGDLTPRAYDGTQDGYKEDSNNDGLNDSDNVELSSPPAPEEQDLPEPICGNSTRDFFKTYGHNDWGSAWGSEVRSRENPYPGAGYQGIAFWARSETEADKSVMLIVETRQTAKPVDAELEDGGVSNDPRDCQEPTINEGAAVYRTLADGTQQITSEVPDENDCGNSFRALVTTSDHWELYRIPFEDFWQERLPNRDPNGLDAGAILTLGIRVEKEKHIELYVTGLSFYREPGFVPEDGPSGTLAERPVGPDDEEHTPRAGLDAGALPEALDAAAGDAAP